MLGRSPIGSTPTGGSQTHSSGGSTLSDSVTESVGATDSFGGTRTFHPTQTEVSSALIGTIILGAQSSVTTNTAGNVVTTQDFYTGNSIAVTSGAGTGQVRDIVHSRVNHDSYTESPENAWWIKTRTTATDNMVIAPDGTLTGGLLVEDTSAGLSHAINKTFVPEVGKQYTHSVYIKSYSGNRTVELYFNAAAYGVTCWMEFDPDTGTMVGGGNGTAKMYYVGGGWYRCILTTVAATVATNGNRSIYLNNGGVQNYDGDGVSGVYLWGMQLEEGTEATEYIHVFDSTRPVGLGVYPPWSMNLLNASEDWAAAYWTLGATTTVTAATIEDTGASLGYVTRVHTGIAAANTPYLFSVYVEKDAVTRATRFCGLRIRVDAAGPVTNYVDVRFDTSTGEFGLVSVGPAAEYSGDVEDHGTHWRVWLSLTSSSTVGGNVNTTFYPAIGASAANWNTSNAATGLVSVSRAQFEIGYYPTPYHAVTTTQMLLPDYLSTYDILPGAAPSTILTTTSASSETGAGSESTDTSMVAETEHASSVTADDVAAAISELLSAVAESSASEEVITAVITKEVGVSDAVTADELASAVASLVAAASENLSATDAHSATAVLVAEFLAPTSAADVVAAIRAAIAAVIDAASAAEAQDRLLTVNVNTYDENRFSTPNDFEIYSAAWAPQGIAPLATTGHAAPDGYQTAWLVKESTASTNHRLYEYIYMESVGGAAKVTIAAKDYSGDRYLNLYLATSAAFGTTPSAVFDVVTGVVFSESNASASMIDLGGGWWECSIVTRASAVAYPPELFAYIAFHNGTTNSYTGVVTSGMYLWNARFSNAAVEANSAVATLHATESGAVAAGSDTHEASTVYVTSITVGTTGSDSWTSQLYIVREQSENTSGTEEQTASTHAPIKNASQLDVTSAADVVVSVLLTSSTSEQSAAASDMSLGVYETTAAGTDSGSASSVADRTIVPSAAAFEDGNADTAQVAYTYVGAEEVASVDATEQQSAILVAVTLNTEVASAQDINEAVASLVSEISEGATGYDVTVSEILRRPTSVTIVLRVARVTPVLATSTTPTAIRNTTTNTPVVAAGTEAKPVVRSSSAPTPVVRATTVVPVA